MRNLFKRRLALKIIIDARLEVYAAVMGHRRRIEVAVNKEGLLPLLLERGGQVDNHYALARSGVACDMQDARHLHSRTRCFTCLSSSPVLSKYSLSLSMSIFSVSPSNCTIIVTCLRYSSFFS